MFSIRPNFLFVLVAVLVLCAVLKAHADVNSLPYRQPVKTDIIRVYDNTGASYGINWQELSHEMTNDINWVQGSTATGANFSSSTGAPNWTDYTRIYKGN